MAGNYELDLTNREFASLIGYEKKVLKDVKNFTGALLSDITRSVDWVFLHCDLSGERCGKRRVVQFVHHRPSGELSFQ